MLAMPKRSVARPAHRRCRRPGCFRPFPLRPRADGWSEERQCGFLCAIARMRVASRQWDRVLTPRERRHVASPQAGFRKVTLLTVNSRLEIGFVKPEIYHGQICDVRSNYDNSTLFRLLKRQGDDPVTPSGKGSAG